MLSAVTTAVDSVAATAWVYPVVAGLVFTDSLIPGFPSESALAAASAWSAATGSPALAGLIAVGFVAAVVGDNVLFAVGSRLVPWVSQAPDESLRRRALSWVTARMDSGAGPIIVVSRFIPGARWVTTVVLAASGYRWSRFVLFDSVGVVLWLAQSLALGYVGGVAFTSQPLLGAAAGIVGSVLVGLLIQVIIRAWDTSRRA